MGVKSQGEVSVWGRKRCAGCGCKVTGSGRTVVVYYIHVQLHMYM